MWGLQFKNAIGSAARREGIYMQSETIEAPGVRNERGEDDTDDNVVHIWLIAPLEGSTASCWMEYCGRD